VGIENPLTSVLTILGPKSSSGGYCDGISRRGFLRIGALGMGGVGLSSLLRAESAAGLRSPGRSHKAVILIYLVGGPPHQDMFDLKPNAPREMAGPHKPIGTNVPGIEICELFPKMARMMDKFALIRSLVGAQAEHDAAQCYTGRPPRGSSPPPAGWPQFGSVVSQMQGGVTPSIPPFVSLCYECTHGPYNEPGPGALGPAQAAV
jgi:hypothetical protein